MADGPAQKQVRSTMRTPASGRPSPRSLGCRAVQLDGSGVLAEAGCGGRTSCRRDRPGGRARGAGGRGARRRRPRGRRTARAPRTEAPSPIGATGTRSSEARAMISSVGCCVVQAWTIASNSSARLVRTLMSTRASSASRSARSMSTRKSLNCWLAMVAKPTQPSAVGSIDGWSMWRNVGSTGRDHAVELGEERPVGVHPHGHALEHRHVDVLAAARPPGGQTGDGGVDPGLELAEAPARPPAADDRGAPGTPSSRTPPAG